jgi:hypothetical protein
MNRNLSLGVLSLLLAAAYAVLSPAHAQGDADCGLNASVASVRTTKDEIIKVCKCNSDYERYLGACIKRACAHAFNRLKAAQEGGRQALVTLRHEATAYPAAKVLRWLDFKGGRTTRALLYLEALRDADSGLDELLAFYANRPAGNDDPIWQAIQTINSFRRQVKATLQQLEQNNCSHD